MPLYSYTCDACNHNFEQSLKIAEMHQPIADPCPSCKAEGQVRKTITGAPSLGDPVRLGVKKTDDGFREVLSKIHESQPKSNLNQKLSRG